MQLFSNNANSMLDAAVGAGAQSLTVAAGDGARFPNPQNGDFFLFTLFQRNGATEQNIEICMCTARNGDVFTTIVREQEGTTARSYNPGDFIELRQTAGSVLPVRNGALTSALNEAAIVPMPSGSSMAIGAAGANTINVIGAATINTFDTIASGAVRRMNFTGTPTINHNIGSLRLLTSAPITAQAGDWCEWQSLGAGIWQMMSYTRASGAALIPDPTKAGLTANTFAGAQSYSEVNKGTVATGIVTFNLLSGNVQRLQVGGALTIALSGFPAAGIFGDLLIKLVNGGIAAVTFPAINWILPATGAPAASFDAYRAAIGRSGLQTNGTDFIYLCTDDAGATVYGKLL
jgi:hypothetical protein